MMSTLANLVRLPRAILRRLWASLWRASQEQSHGYKFLLTIYTMRAYAYLGELVRRKKKLNSSDPPCEQVIFNAVRLQATNRGPAAGIGPKDRVLHADAESIQGQIIIQDGVLVNSGDSILHHGHYLCGRWRERSDGHTIESTEIDYHNEAQLRDDIHGESVIINGRSLCLTGPWSDNYYHWLFQYLPILRIAGECIRMDEIDNVLVKGPIKPFQSESLSLLGIPPQKIIGISPGKNYLAEELVLTTIPCANRTYTPWAIDFLRQLRQPQTTPSSPIFFDRHFPATRRIVNAEEVYSVLESYGIQCIDCGSLSFSDQVRLASSANLLLGIHGASLANAVFSAPGTTLLELTPRNYSPPYFSGLAKVCQLNYARVMGREPGPLSTWVPIKRADIIVPIDILRLKLERFFHPC